jgi:hypothetical protein
MSTLDILRAKFPGRVTLSPREVAQAMHGDEKATKKRIEAIRKKLDEGTLIPGIRKAKGDKRWSIPLAALARALDERGRIDIAPDLPPALTPVSGQRRSRMTNIGPRMTRLIERSRFVLQSILDEMRILKSFEEREILRAVVADRAVDELPNRIV